MVTRRQLAAAALLVLAAPLASQQHARIDRLLPHGAARGSDVTLSLRGRNLNAIQGVFLLRPGLVIRKILPPARGAARVRVHVSADCPIGVHRFAVRTPYGTSNLVTFHVGDLREMREKEPNNSVARAERVSLDTTVNGTITRGDIDVFAIDLAPKEVLQVEVEGLRLGALEFDPFLELLDATGRVVVRADDSLSGYLDPRLTFTAPAAAASANVSKDSPLPARHRYFLRLRENGHGGSGRHDYRMHVGRFPRPQMAWPPGGKPNEKLLVEWFDANGDPAGKEQLTLPAKPGIARLHPKNRHGSCPTPVALRVSNLPTLPFAPSKQPAVRLGAFSFIGPFPAKNAKGKFVGHTTVFGPERSPGKVNLKASFPGRDKKKIVWRRLPFRDNRPFDLRRHFRKSNAAVVYAHRTLTAPTARNVLLLFGSDDTLKVWLNGKRVHDVSRRRSLRRDQDRLILKLHKGPNQLLCKITNHDGPFAFHFRMVDPQRVASHQLLQPPIALHGRITKPGLMHNYRFLARRGETWTFQAFARGQGSALDPLLDIYGGVERFYVANDDSRGADSVLRFRAPHTGEFVFRVRDALNQGSPQHIYRVEVTKPRARPLRTEVNIPGVRNLWACDVPQGGRSATLLLLRDIPRGKGPLQLAVQGLPAGVRADIPPLPAGTNRVPVVLHAAADAKPGSGELLRWHATRGGKPVAGGHHQPYVLVEARNRRPFLTTRVHRMPVAVTKPLPFRVEVTPLRRPLMQNSPLTWQIAIHRNKKFRQTVRIRMLGTPPGVAANQLTLRGNQTKGVLRLSARGNARPGRYPVVLLATSNVAGGTVTASSTMQTLGVSSPWFSGRMPRVRSSQGKPVELVLPLTVSTAGRKHFATITGKMQARLLGLPGGTSAGPATLVLDAEKKSQGKLRFAIKLANNARPGRHRALRVRLQIPTKQGVVTQDFTGGELRIDRRTPKTAPSK